MAGSRFLKDSEKGYSLVEGEALTITKGKMFCLGNPNLSVSTDHKPLLSIMGDKTMDQVDNPRLLSFK